MRARDLLTLVLVLVPLLANVVVLYRLSSYRRDGLGFLATLFSWNFHVLRPDLYTDEGQDLLRWAWALAIVSAAWIPLVILLIH
jgi:hypothetical protein